MRASLGLSGLRSGAWRAPLLPLLAFAHACSNGGASSGADPVTVSEASEVVGVPDHGLDPSVVTVTTAWGAACTGVLLASDVVLTARRCVTRAPDLGACVGLELPPPPTADPRSLRVSSASAASIAWSAPGDAVLTSNAPITCGADLALIVLAWPAEGAVASIVSESGIAEGSYVRTVGLGRVTATGPQEEVLREHLPVLDVSATEAAVAEASCVGAPGEVAFDEATGAVVGVLSRWGTECGAPDAFDVFTRADAFYGLIQDALAWEPALTTVSFDGGLVLEDAGKRRDAGRAKKPATDLGATCTTGGDCGTGICVDTSSVGGAGGAGQYCSETCTPADRCPTYYKCVIATNGQSVCVLL